MKAITIICAGNPAHALIGDTADDGTGGVIITTHDLTADEEEGPAIGVQLDKERARMLFNWLAVFLHS